MVATIERAFELARDGSCRSINDIKRKLQRERHEAIDVHLGGKAIREQLHTLLDRKRAASPPPTNAHVWTVEDIATLVRLAAEGQQLRAIAQTLGRSQEATRSRASKLKIEISRAVRRA